MSEEKEREGFVFYTSFYKSILKLKKPKDRLEMFIAICEYAIYRHDIEEELGEMTGTIFPLMKPQIDANYQKYLNGSKPKAKQKQNGSETEAEEKQNGTKEKEKEKDKVKDKEKVKEKGSAFSNPKAKLHFDDPLPGTYDDSINIKEDMKELEMFLTKRS